MVIWKVCKDVFHPFTLLAADRVASIRLGEHPFIQELTSIPKFGSDRWDTEFSQSPVVLVATQRQAHDFLTCSFHGSLREGCLLRDLKEDLKDTRPSLFYIVFLPTVERIDECIAI